MKKTNILHAPTFALWLCVLCIIAIAKGFNNSERNSYTIRKNAFHSLEEQKLKINSSSTSSTSSSSSLSYYPKGGLFEKRTTFSRTKHDTIVNKISPLFQTITPDFTNNVNSIILFGGIPLKTFITQISSAMIAYFGSIIYYDRPRGKLLIENPSTIFRIAPSQVANAGLGLYVTQSLPEGTKLGTYPGVVRPLQTNLHKLQLYPQCEAYIWRFSDSSKVIDPTDAHGNIQNLCYGGSDKTPLSMALMNTPWMKQFMVVPTTLTRINEPPPIQSTGTFSAFSGGCNVRTVEDLEKEEIIFELARDVYEGEELFMDYGLSYDRSAYTPPPPSSNST